MLLALLRSGVGVVVLLGSGLRVGCSRRVPWVYVLGPARLPRLACLARVAWVARLVCLARVAWLPCLARLGLVGVRCRERSARVGGASRGVRL
jgi:hypothetical protein